MRNAFAKAVISQCSGSDYFFLTGDLGFMALEEVRDAFGKRFINAGVAEQNMVGVAAGLARDGFKVFVYSIAPFCYARPFEQIRNDICFSNLPVCLVGNGGGYAYGHMGPTHHALEDCAVMSSLGVKIHAPAFDSDIPALIDQFASPTYLRLGVEVMPDGAAPPPYASWRELLPGAHGTLVALGPLAGVAWRALRDIPARLRPAVWAVTGFDAADVPQQFLDQARNSKLFVIEEHVASGGLAMHLSLLLAKKGVQVSSVEHRHALGYPSGRFGSQAFHRTECGLDADGILNFVLESSNGT